MRYFTAKRIFKQQTSCVKIFLNMIDQKDYIEKTMVAVKPDGVRRQLVGEIISRFEKVQLKLVACKMIKIPEELAFKHYGQNEEWFLNIGKKMISFYKEHGFDPKEKIGTLEPMEIGKLVQKWNVNYLTEGPVVATVWEGVHAVEIVRKIVGSTLPVQSPPGTIRGDFAVDSSYSANEQGRSIQNLIHASGTVEEAKLEIELWFKKDEIYSY
jgi:nucleoside-diphosphate kinase